MTFKEDKTLKIMQKRGIVHSSLGHTNNKLTLKDVNKLERLLEGVHTRKEIIQYLHTLHFKFNVDNLYFRLKKRENDKDV